MAMIVENARKQEFVADELDFLIKDGFFKLDDKHQIIYCLEIIADNYKKSQLETWDKLRQQELLRREEDAMIKARKCAVKLKDLLSTVDGCRYNSVEQLMIAVDLFIANNTSSLAKGRPLDRSRNIVFRSFKMVWLKYCLKKTKQSVPARGLKLARIFLESINIETTYPDDTDLRKAFQKADRAAASRERAGEKIELPFQILNHDESLKLPYIPIVSSITQGKTKID